DLPDRLMSGQRCRKPIEAERDSPHRRRAELQRLEKESEPGPGLYFVEADQGKDPLLHGLLMDTNRATSRFLTVQDQIVRFSLDASGVGLEQGEILIPRRGERMMYGVPSLLVVVPFDEREVDNPCEDVSIGRNHL